MPMTEPTVSVIIPTYNRAALVREAIDSVLGQTFDDFEVIVVDDGSSDTTATAAQVDDPRVRYVCQVHAGRSAARNRGLDAARGQYVAFLDDDDLYLPGKLAGEVAVLEADSELGLVAGGTRIVRADGTVIGEVRPWTVVPRLGPLECLGGCPWCTCGALIRRRAIDALDYCFDETLDQAEDADFFMRLVLSGCRVAWWREIDSCYRLLSTRGATYLFENSLALRRALRSILARPDLPAEVRACERDAMLRHYLFTAFRSMASGQTEPVQRDLLHAWIWAPHGFEEGFIAEMLRVARTPYFVGDAGTFVNEVFDRLPPRFAWLASRRGEALAALAAMPVADAPSATEQK
jgi:glycosyltransferase involved in cell wall biosynthesis